VSALGALVGAAAAGGALLVARGVAARRPASLAERVAPYLNGPSAVASSVAVGADASTLVRILAPSLQDLGARLDAVVGGSAALRARLDSAGAHETSPAQFRLEQLVWAVTGLLASGVVLALVSAAGRPVRPAAATILAIVCGVTGVLARDRALATSVSRRREGVRLGLPAVADLLALAVASGESPVAALDRVARVARGPLAQECRRACDDTASGVSFIDALDAMAVRAEVPAVRRFVDGVAIAVQRGTPLADVLRAQAGDARADLHRSLLEIAGRKELLMLMPVVFLVLPTVVLVALFPAVTSLTSISP
jgi:tight adherence protein C